MKILAIESSCDETAVAIVEDGRKVLSNAVFRRQICMHCMEGLCLKSHHESILSVFLP